MERARVWRRWWWGVPRGRARRLLVAAVPLFLAGSAAAQVTFPSVVDRAVGVRTALFPGADEINRPPRWSVEVADAELFGIAGLRVTGVQAATKLGLAMLRMELAEIASPVGEHTRAVVEAGHVRTGVWQGGVRAGIERVTLRSVWPERSLVGGAFSRADLGPVALVADVEAMSGAFVRSTSVSIAVLGRAGAMATVVGSLHFNGSRVVAAGVAVVARLDSRLGLIAGYDDGTDTSRVAARIAVGRVEVATGVTHHAVLGLSHGVSVTWTR
jgi:hypothetical protein